MKPEGSVDTAKREPNMQNVTSVVMNTQLKCKRICFSYYVLLLCTRLCFYELMMILVQSCIYR